MKPKRTDRKKSSRKPEGAKPRHRAGAATPAGGGTTVRVRKLPDEQAWELVPPRCARDRQEDLEEVRKMVEAGEIDVAVDECLWLLSGCGDCLEAHRILGEIALSDNDLPLARAHFGHAYRLGVKAIEQAGSPAPLPYSVPANESFLESAKGLAWCLRQLGKREMAEEVVAIALRCDPSDPLALKGLLAE